MTPNYIYVEPPFWVASNPDETAVKQLCVELEEHMNSPNTVDGWGDFLQRCKKYWELAAHITIERYPITTKNSQDALPVVAASSKVALKNLATSTELMDVANVYALKRCLNN